MHERTVADHAVGYFYEKIKAMGTEFSPGSKRQLELQKSARRFLDQPKQNDEQIREAAE